MSTDDRKRHLDGKFAEEAKARPSSPAGLVETPEVTAARDIAARRLNHERALRDVFNLPVNTLHRLVVRPDVRMNDVLAEIRATVVRQASKGSQSWQEAWNTASGATEHRTGFLSVSAHLRCDQCRGKRIDMRRGGVCTKCMGRGRTFESIRMTTEHVTPPEQHGPPMPSTDAIGLSGADLDVRTKAFDAMPPGTAVLNQYRMWRKRSDGRWDVNRGGVLEPMRSLELPLDARQYGTADEDF